MARPRLTDEDIWELLYNCPEDGASEGPSDDDQADRDYVEPDDSASSSSSGEIPSPRKARYQAYVAASTSRPHQAPTRRQHGPDPDSSDDEEYVDDPRSASKLPSWVGTPQRRRLFPSHGRDGRPSKRGKHEVAGALFLPQPDPARTPRAPSPPRAPTTPRTTSPDPTHHHPQPHASHQASPPLPDTSPQPQNVGKGVGKGKAQRKGRGRGSAPPRGRGRGRERGRGRGRRDAACPPPRRRDPGDNGGGPSDDDDNDEVREEEWVWEDGSDFVPVVYPFTAPQSGCT